MTQTHLAVYFFYISNVLYNSVTPRDRSDNNLLQTTADMATGPASQPPTAGDCREILPYDAIYPTNVLADLSIKRFVSDFFKVSDNPELTDLWLSFFHEDATLVMGNNKAEGKQGTTLLPSITGVSLTGWIPAIRELRIGMWKDVSARQHKLEKVFPASFGGGNTTEFMIYGSVKYRPRVAGSTVDSEAQEVTVDWAARAELTRSEADASWGFAHYRVYLQR